VADELEVADGWTVPDSALSERFSRSSGPGGQGVNTTDSRVELSVDLNRPDAVPDRLRSRVLDRLASRLVDGVLTVSAGEHRAQLDNRRAARERLADLLRRAGAAPPRRRRPTRPTRGSKERRLSEKKRRGDIKRGRQGRFE
jgi:ribosome-associated protein